MTFYITSVILFSVGYNNNNIEGKKDMNGNLINQTLGSMSRSQLRNTARRLGVRTGHDKADTIANIRTAIENNDARFTVQFTIRPNTDRTARYMPAVFSAKLRTHKPNKVLVQPTA